MSFTDVCTVLLHGRCIVLALNGTLGGALQLRRVVEGLVATGLLKSSEQTYDTATPLYVGFNRRLEGCRKLAVAIYVCVRLMPTLKDVDTLPKTNPIPACSTKKKRGKRGDLRGCRTACAPFAASRGVVTPTRPLHRVASEHRSSFRRSCLSTSGVRGSENKRPFPLSKHVFLVSARHRARTRRHGAREHERASTYSMSYLAS